MNRFGYNLVVEVWGESHGPAVGVLIDGYPAGRLVDEDAISRDLDRRRPRDREHSERRERDGLAVLAGVYRGRTTGGPILFSVENRSQEVGAYPERTRYPRPGHADLVALRRSQGFHDPRGGGRYSGRLTAGLVVAGRLSRDLLPFDFAACLEEDPRTIPAGDSRGGVIAGRVSGVPCGLGEPFWDSVESLLAHALFAVPGVKAVEFGAGFGAADMLGSEFNDQYISPTGETRTNNAGGINGGLTNGNEIVFRVAVRPPASISLPQQTIDLETGMLVERATRGRHDARFASRLPVVVESVAAIVLADLTFRRSASEPVTLSQGGLDDQHRWDL